MDKKACICTVVAVLGTISAGAGIGAEFTRVKASEARDSYCSYSTSPALVLGLIAAVTLLISQIIINCATGCLCCCRGTNQNSNWAKALIFFILSRLAFVIAFYLFLSGAALNSNAFSGRSFFGSGNEDSSYYYQCYVVKPGAFAIASVLAAASVIFGICHYLASNTIKKNTTSVPNYGNGNGFNNNNNNGPNNFPDQNAGAIGIMIAEPQLPHRAAVQEIEALPTATHKIPSYNAYVPRTPLPAPAAYVPRTPQRVPAYEVMIA